MDGDDWVMCAVYLVIAGLGAVLIFSVVGSMFGPSDSFTGELIDVEYSSAGYGHSDIMVFYFQDGTILRFSGQGTSEVHLGNCTVFYRGTYYYRTFDHIVYLED